MIRSESKRSFCGAERTTKWQPRCDYPDAVRWQHFLAPQTEFELNSMRILFIRYYKKNDAKLGYFLSDIIL